MKKKNAKIKNKIIIKLKKDDEIDFFFNSQIYKEMFINDKIGNEI